MTGILLCCVCEKPLCPLQIQSQKKQKDTQIFTTMQTFSSYSPKFDVSFVFLTHEFELESNLTPTITCTLVPAERCLHSHGRSQPALNCGIGAGIAVAPRSTEPHGRERACIHCINPAMAPNHNGSASCFTSTSKIHFNITVNIRKSTKNQGTSQPTTVCFAAASAKLPEDPI